MATELPNDLQALVEEDERREPGGVGDPGPDPFLGSLRDAADELDAIVADAYRKRREETWRGVRATATRSSNVSKQNHALIGFDPTFDLKAAIDSWLGGFRSLVDWPVPHYDRLHDAAELVYIRHFGFEGVPPVGEFLNGGLDTALDYFLGPKRDEDRRDEIWYEPLRDGLMLGMLSERWDDVARLCGWVRADLVAEYCGPIDYRIPQLYLLIAGSLRGGPLEGGDELEASIAKSRTKRPRALLKAWRAALDGDQAGFDSAMRQSLASFAARPPLPPNDGYVGERIARAETAVCLAAMHFGLRFPEIPEELAARVVTRESLGLEG